MKIKKLSVFIICFFLSTFVSESQNTDSLRKLIREEGNLSIKAKYLHDLAGIISRDSLIEAIELENIALELADPESDKKLLMDVYSKLGLYYYRISDYKNSIYGFEEALKKAESLNDTINIVKLLNNLGVINQILGMYDISLQYLNRSVEFKKILNDTLGLAKSFNNISVIYKNLGRYDEAYLFTKKALSAYERIGSVSDLADVYNNLGTIYEAWLNYDTALYYYYKSLKLKNEVGNLTGLANTYNNIGMVYLFELNFDSSLRNLNAAAGIRQKINDRYGLVSSYHNLGLFFLTVKQYDSALAGFRKSIAIAKQESMLENLQRNYANLSRTFDSLGNIDSAYKYFQLYADFKDSVAKKDLQDQLSNLALKYETDQLEQEKILFKKESQLQKEKRIKINFVLYLVTAFFIFIVVILLLRFREKNKANKALIEKNKLIFRKQKELEEVVKKLNESENRYKELNASKDKFFNIIAHDLKNPFSTVVNFSEVLLSEEEDLSEPEKMEILRVIKETTFNTLQLLENLLNWSRTQTGRIAFNPVKLVLKILIEDVLTMLSSTASRKEIQIRVDCNDDFVVRADENMLKTILRNLITNAIKYTDRDGQILISASVAEGEDTVVCVKDNGIGISAKNQKKLFSLEESTHTRGTDDETGTGLGLILCKEFVEYHKGKIWVESESGKGSKFCINLPFDNL